MKLIKKTFEDILPELDSILRSKKSFWNLDAITHVNYDDICQEIRIHVNNKFVQWDQERPFIPWASELVNRQISNLKEKYYGRFAPPCRTCKHDLGENRCDFTSCGQKTSECELLRKWKQSKEPAYRMLLAESSDETNDLDFQNEPKVQIEAEGNPDYIRASERLHDLVLKGLNEQSRKIYRLLFIENRSDEYVAQEMGYRTTEAGMKPGYRRISGMKKLLIARAKKIMSDHDVFEQ